MTDQLNFEMRLDAAVKIYAANADGPVDAALIAATAVKASRRAGWWTRLSSIVQPRAADLPRQAMRLLLVATVAIVAIGSIGGFAIYWQRFADVPPPASTATPAPSPSGLAPTPSDSTVDATPLAWPGAVRPDADAMPVLAMSGPSRCIGGGPSAIWEDGLDAEEGFVDIIETSRGGFRLASKPPLASDLDPSVELIEYGLVFDTDADGTPDYELGINNSPGRGDYRVWVTDLESGEAFEQIGPPYGFPVEFRHPDEQEIDDFHGPSMAFWFLSGYGSPPLVDLRRDSRFYAWSSYSEDGSVVAWDYAPDFGWLELPACESLPVQVWPSTSQNPPGMYSWDGSGGDPSHLEGFMHNGYGSGDVEIHMRVVPEVAASDGDVRTEVAGHHAIYRRIDARHKEWIVEIDGTTIEIRLEARSGTSQADLDDAHAIIESMTYEPTDSRLGFRLIFTLTNDDWDSG